MGSLDLGRSRDPLSGVGNPDRLDGIREEWSEFACWVLGVRFGMMGRQGTPGR